jgi:ceramide glucosyltransferase
VRGCDREFYQCIRTFAGQEYGEFELLFAVRDPQDPAVAEIQRLAREFPGRRIEVFVIDASHGPNDKVNGLERLRREARYELLVISDSDIRVGPDYLRRVTAPLADPKIGLVTCPYRGVPGGGLASLLEALWISTDFQASVLVARLLGMQFALGATMALRRADLERIGGFAPLAGYLADDFWLGQKIHGLGRRIALSDGAVETVLPREGWRESWQHRVRWGRTLRVCRAAGYGGALITFAVPLALAALALAPRLWPWAATAVGLRFAAGLGVGVARMRDPVAARWWALLPLADVMSFLVWAASLVGSRVVWRGEVFRLRRDGRLV